MWDGCTVFWFLFLHVVFFVCRLCLPQKKHVPPAGKKNTKHAHELQDCPPRHLLTFDSGLSFFPCLFLHVLNWVHVSYRSCLPQKEPWITWQRKNTITFRMEIPDWCWGICTLWSCAQEAACGYPWIKPLTRHSFQNCWNLQTSLNLVPKSCEINGRFMMFPLRPDAAVRCCCEGLCLCGRAAPEIWRFGGGAEWERPRPQRQAPGESWEDLMVDVCWCSNV